MQGKARMRVTSSTDWWVLPSPKSDSPLLEPQTRTFSLGMQIELRS